MILGIIFDLSKYITALCDTGDHKVRRESYIYLEKLRLYMY